MLTPRFIHRQEETPDEEAHEALEVGFGPFGWGVVGSQVSKPWSKLGASLQCAHSFGHIGSLSYKEKHG